MRRAEKHVLQRVEAVEMAHDFDNDLWRNGGYVLMHVGGRRLLVVAMIRNSYIYRTRMFEVCSNARDDARIAVNIRITTTTRVSSFEHTLMGPQATQTISFDEEEPPL